MATVDLHGATMSATDYAKVILSNVYYFVLRTSQKKPIAELSWLQRLAFKKAKCFFESIGRGGELTITETHFGLDDTQFALLNGVVRDTASSENDSEAENAERAAPVNAPFQHPIGILPGSEEVFNTFAEPNAQKAINIIYDYEKALSTTLNNPCFIKPTLPSPLENSVTWTATPGSTEITYPSQNAADIFNRYFPNFKSLGAEENGYYLWKTINSKVHFFWRNILVPAHEVIHRHHLVDSDLAGKKYTGNLPAPAPAEGGPIDISPFPVKSTALDAFSDMMGGFDLNSIKSTPGQLNPGESAKYNTQALADAISVLGQNCPAEITLTYEQIRDWRHSLGCTTLQYNEAEGTATNTRMTTALYTGNAQRGVIPNRPQRGGYSMAYASEMLASAGNLNIFVRNIRNKFESNGNNTSKLLYQCHALFGMLYVTEKLNIIDKNVHRLQSDIPRQQQQQIKNYTHFSRLTPGQTHTIPGRMPRGRPAIYSGQNSLKNFEDRIHAFVGSATPPWANTYAKHLIALEYAADFFKGKDTLANYFNPNFWANVANEWVLDVNGWSALGERPPGGLAVADWITQDIPCAAPAATLAGGRRRYFKTTRMRNRNTKKRALGGRRARTNKRRY